jgi:hypothetical protein
MRGLWVTASATLSLTSLLAPVPGPPNSDVPYIVGGTVAAAAALEAAAQLLADDAMRLRCGDAPALASWRARRDGGPELTGTRAAAVATFASMGFGLPSEPAKNEDHIQGHLAELLWNRLLAERVACADGRRLVRVADVKTDPLEPGGDGLVVYRTADGTLVFRLWEIKKHDSVNQLSATIRTASNQLANRGDTYLGKIVGPASLEGGEIGAFFAEVIELWIDRSERAGVGVSVGTSAHHAPRHRSSFRSLASAFPAFVPQEQTEGIAVAVADFPAFARRVKEIVWSGL